MKKIKLFDGTNVTVDGKTVFCGGPQEMFKLLNMGAPEYEEARIAVLRYLSAFHKMDLSAAFPGHTVTIEIVPTKEDAE